MASKNPQDEELLKRARLEMTSPSDAQNKPLQLIEFSQSGDAGSPSIQLNSDTVDLLFQKIGDLPTSVICVCGTSRPEKNVLLNYMIRCLEGLEKDEDEDWMCWNDKKKLLKGFTLQSGTAPATKGIWIWSKPFVLKDDKRNDVAVLLMDSQGPFDDTHSINDTSALLGLSFFTSSLMVVSLFNDLQEDVLTSLKPYIQYGNKVLENGLTSPFQKLNFLIGNWNNPTQFSFGAKGGKLFLESKLKIQNSQSPEAKYVREKIRKCFQELDCFLMPEIGEHALGENFQGFIDELSSKYATELENFIDSLFLNGNLPVKEILGSPVSATSFRSCLEGYVKLFNWNQAPSVNNMGHATSRIYNKINVIDKAMEKYRETVETESTNRLQVGALQSAHVKAKEQALELFNQTKKFGNSDTISELKQKLESDLEVEFSKYIMLRGNRRTFVTDETTEATNTFRSKLEEKFRFTPGDHLSFYENAKIMKSFYKAKSTVLEDFKKKLESETEDKQTALVMSLTEIMQSILDSIMNKNKVNRANAEAEITLIVDELSTQHNEGLRAYLQENQFEEDDFTIQNAHNELKSTTVENYRERQKPGNEGFQALHQKKLESEMESNLANLRNEHQLRIEQTTQGVETSIKAYCDQLESEMNTVVARGNVEEKQVKEMYTRKVESLQAKFDREDNPFPTDSPRSTELKNTLEEQLAQLLIKILRQVPNKQLCLETWQKARRHALDYYKRTIKELSDSCDFLPEEDLLTEYKRIQDEALIEFEKFKKIGIPPNASEMKQELKEKIEDDWERLQERNSLRLSLAISNIKNCARECYDDYNKTLKKELNHHPTMDDLQDCHKNAKEVALDRLNKRCPPNNPRFNLKIESELETRIEGAFRELLRKKRDEVTTATKEVLVEARKYYHEDMKKHFQNHQFMKPAQLAEIHKQVKHSVMEKCKFVNNQYRLSDLEEELEGLLDLYVVKNDMNLNSGDCPAIGIDLGTTHCCVAVHYKGKVHIVPNQQQGGIETIPSYVAYNLDGTETYGAPAKRDAYKNAERTIYDAKRIIGRKMDDPELIEDMKWWPFEVREDEGVPKIMCNYKALHPEQVSGKLLTHCKEIAEGYLKMRPGTIKKAVITVPAYFNDGQRQATVDAGKLAKLEVLTIMNEPTAAAVAYSLERLDNDPRKVLIYDLGGGTFDVAVVDLKPKIIDVRGVKGDTHLGGADFDKKMMEYCVQQFKVERGVDLFAEINSDVKQLRDDARRRIMRLQAECECAKKILSTAKSVDVVVVALIYGMDLRVPVTRKIFEDLNLLHFEKSIKLVEEALLEAWVKKEEIDDVVLVGGSSRIPKVQEMLSALFSGKALNKSIHPDLAVAYGAAVQAARMNGEQSKGKIDFSEIQDVTPMPLGVEVKSKELSVIIPKNTQVPTKQKEVYGTVLDNQTEIEVIIYQGEDLKLAANNKKLGTFNLKGIPRKKAGAEPIDIWMEINSMGILHVKAVCRSTLKWNSITVEENKQRMSDMAIQKILDDETVSNRPEASTSVFDPSPRTIRRTGETPRNDILWMILESSLSEEARLRPRIIAFQGPHFTSSFEMLRKECTDLQSELRQLDVAGRAGIFGKTKDALHRARILEKRLTRKVHVDGKRCLLCPVVSE